MVILIGLILLAVGISLAVNQWAALLVTLQALLTLSLLFWGGILVLVGYSELKARREYAQATRPETDGEVAKASQNNE